MCRILKIFAFSSAALMLLLLGGWLWHGLTTRPQADKQLGAPVWGNVENLRDSYERWKAGHEANGGDRNLILALAWSEALSSEFTDARGEATINLIDQVVSVEVEGLPKERSWDVWLVDNLPGDKASVMPESSDASMHLGSLRQESDKAFLEVELQKDAFSGFELDLIVVSEKGREPADGVLFGAPSLFQRLYTRIDRGRHETNRFASRDLVGSVWASSPSVRLLQELIADGEHLFFNETFDGNGRTCGTCHRAENNLTIDPVFIATLPDNDPLFVAEFIPALVFGDPANLDGDGNPQRFENPILLRKLGLFVENVDGTDDLENKFTMRGVPHTLGLSKTLGHNGDQTGWSGDGAPGLGTLRDFANGAVNQHFPLTLNREVNVDFRLPTDEELDAMEAFQLSLGRQEDLALPLDLKGEVVSRGQEIFLGSGRCSVCHANAGANASFGPANRNRNFDTGVEDLPDQPATLTGELFPRDGGAGQAPNASGAFGDGKFNTPSLVEAADTPPFFHNNAISTIEGAVAFYNSDAFNNSPAGAPNPIHLETTQVEAVAAFLRVINALQNIEESLDLLQRVQDVPKGSHKEYLDLASHQINDTINVLEGGGLHSESYHYLYEALRLVEKSSGKGSSIKKAMSELESARNHLVQ